MRTVTEVMRPGKHPQTTGETEKHIRPKTEITGTKRSSSFAKKCSVIDRFLLSS